MHLKIDVLLSAHVFQKFVKTCLDYCGLGPCHYFSAPGLSWDAMLKMTGVESDHISDINIHLFIEKQIRGGISYIAKRHSEIEDCDSNKKRKPSCIGMQIICMDGE